MPPAPTDLPPFQVADVHHRMAYHHPDVPMLLLWSEKSGCTSLLQWFLALTGDLERATAASSWIHDWELGVMKARPGYPEEVADRLRAGDPVYKLVRDPFARAVSGFFMMSILGDDTGHFTVDLRHRIRRWLYGDSIAGHSFSFLDYLRWLSTLADADGHLALASGDDLDDHLAPQRNRLETLLPHVTFLRLERFDDEIEMLTRSYDLPRVDLRTATTSHHHTVRANAPTDDADVTVRMHFPIPTPPGYPLPTTREFVTPETVALVRALYHVDYEAYGYDVPSCG
jgi:hypothetical protein